MTDIESNEQGHVTIKDTEMASVFIRHLIHAIALPSFHALTPRVPDLRNLLHFKVPTGN